MVHKKKCIQCSVDQPRNNYSKTGWKEHNICIKCKPPTKPNVNKIGYVQNMKNVPDKVLPRLK